MMMVVIMIITVMVMIDDDGDFGCMVLIMTRMITLMALRMKIKMIRLF